MKAITFLYVTWFLSTVTWAASGITYHGRILRPDNTPVTSAATEFRIQIKSPGDEGCLLWEEFQTKDLSSTSGVFSITIGDIDETNRSQVNINNPLTGFPFTLLQVFSNKNSFPSGLTCDDTSGTYTPATNHGRTFQVYFREGNTGPWEMMPPSSINYVPLAYNSTQFDGYRSNEFLKIDSLAVYTPLTAGQVNTLVDIIAGTNNQYLRPATTFGGDVSGTYNAISVNRIRNTNVVATAPTLNQVLKFDGTNWVPSPDDTGGTPSDASYTGKGIVQVLTDQTASGLAISGGVLSMPAVGTAATYGDASTIPVITTDAKGRVSSVVATTVDDTSKLPLNGGTMLGAINMGTHNITNATSIAATNFSGRNFVFNDNDTNTATLRAPTDITTNYALTLPTGAPQNGYVLSTDAAGQLSWIAAASGSMTGISSTNLYLTVDSTTPATPTLTVNVGTAANTVAAGNDSRITGALQSATFDGYVSNANCTTSQTMYWNAVGDEFLCQSIALTLAGDVTGAHGTNTVERIRGVNVDPTAPTLNQVLKYDGTNWVASPDAGLTAETDPNVLAWAKQAPHAAFTTTGNELGLSTRVPVSAAAPVGGQDGQTLRWNNTSGQWEWFTPGVAGSGFNQGGNTFGANAVLGTNDNFALNFETNGTAKMTLTPAGFLGVNTTTPQSFIDIAVPISDTTSGAEITLSTHDQTYAQPSLFLLHTRPSFTTGYGSAGVGGWRVGSASGSGGSGGMAGDFTLCSRNGVAGENCQMHIDFGTGNMTLGSANASAHLSSKVSVSGNMTVGETWSNWSTFQAAPTNGLIVEGMIGAGASVPTSALDVNGATTVRGMAAPGLSPVGQGRIYFDSGLNRFRVSQNNGAYTDLVSSGGITSLNGLTVGTQTFAVTATGTAPDINSAAGVHTLSIPLASGAGVTSGTISKSDYDDFVAKLTSPLTTKGDLLVHDGSAHVRLPAGTPGQLLSVNAATASGLEWVAAPTGDITEIVAGDGLTGDATSGVATLAVGAGTGIIANANDVAIDAGLGANKVPMVGGAPLGASGVVVANGMGTALTSLNCSLNQIIKFDASGFATCGTDDVGTGAFVNNGNSFGGAATLGTNDNFALNFETNNQPRMTILNSGNVGIGETNPTSSLVVKGSWTAFVAETVNNGSVAATFSGPNGPRIQILNTNSYGGAGQLTGIDFTGYHDNPGIVDLGSIRTIQQNNTPTGYAADMTFLLADAGVPIAEKMRLTQEGYLGVGVSAPTTSLHLVGAVTQNGMSAPGLSSAGQGRIYFDSASNRFRVSQNGGGYVDMIPSGGAIGGTGSTNAIPKFTASGTIGDSAISDNGTVITATRSIATTTNPIASGATINLATSNTHTLTSVGGSTITVTNPSNGGVYNIVIEDTASRTYTFSGCTSTYFKPANAATALGTRTVYGLMTIQKGGNWDCYVTWSTGFQ